MTLAFICSGFSRSWSNSACKRPPDMTHSAPKKKLLHLGNPIEKPWKALRASVLRTRHTVPRKRSYPAASAVPEGAAKRECTLARCSTSGRRNYADSKDEMPAARRTAPGGCKKHANLQVRVRTAKYVPFLNPIAWIPWTTLTLMRLLEKRTEVENEIMKMYNTEKAE